METLLVKGNDAYGERKITLRLKPLKDYRSPLTFSYERNTESGGLVEEKEVCDDTMLHL